MDRILLVTRNQSKHPDRGCAKASHDGRISGRGEFNRASPKKNVRKILDVIPSSYGSSPLRGEYVDDAGGAVDEIGSSPLRGEYLDEIIQSL